MNNFNIPNHSSFYPKVNKWIYHNKYNNHNNHNKYNIYNQLNWEAQLLKYPNHNPIPSRFNNKYPNPIKDIGINNQAFQ